MNKDRLLAIPAGPGLDRLVAEKIMGWAVHFRNSALYCPAHERDSAMTTCPATVSEWRPSRDIGDAWRVVAQMGELGAAGAFQLDCSPPILGFWASFGLSAAHASSAPEAICRAALLSPFGGFLPAPAWVPEILPARSALAADALAGAVEGFLSARRRYAKAGKRAANDLREPWAKDSAALMAAAREEMDSALQRVGIECRAYRAYREG